MFLRRLFLIGAAALAFAGTVGPAHGQTSPGFVQFQPLGATQLNNAFIGKLDYGSWSGGTLCGQGLSGTTICSGAAIPSPVITGATITGSFIDSSGIGQTDPAAGAFTVISGYGVETINLNASLAPPAGMTGAGIRLVQADGVISRIEADAFGNFASMTASRFDGTAAAPTAVLSGEETGGIGAGGYDSAAVATSGKFRCYASQNQAVGAHGTKCAIATTPNGSTTLTDQVMVFQDGGVTVGTATGGDKGANSINVGALYINGTAPVSGVSSVFGRVGAVVAATSDYTIAQIAGLGTGVATFLGAPSSANLAAAITDETGSGALVFANSPAFTTPNLGTPSALVLTNATGTPSAINLTNGTACAVSSCVSGLGTGVAALLAGASSGTGAPLGGTAPTLSNGVFNGTATIGTPANWRTALGVTATGADTAYAFRANNLSDLASATTARTNLGVAIGTNVEAWDADLDALAALSGTNTIYYRSAANTWSAVTIGSNLTFSGGTLAASGGGSGGTSGTWTPAFSFATNGNLSVSYNAGRFATYTCVNVTGGALVEVEAHITASAFTFTTASGALLMGPLPYAITNTGTAAGGTITNTNGNVTWTGQLSLQVADATHFGINKLASGSSGVAMTTSSFTTGSPPTIDFTATYEAAGPC
jgi:hypothetical protein